MIIGGGCLGPPGDDPWSVSGARLAALRVAQCEVGDRSRFSTYPPFSPPPLSAHQTFYVNDLHTVDYRPERFPFERLRRVNFDPNLCIS
jgi:hypothetical protein